MKKIIIGSDHAGFRLKEALKPYLEKLGFIVKDAGTYSQESCDYPLIAEYVARQVSKRRFLRGILICKTGIGNSIAANKVSRVRAALCYNIEVARLSRQHNNSNVLVLGADYVKTGIAKRIVRVWLKAKFQGGRHRRRIKQIGVIEKG